MTYKGFAGIVKAQASVFMLMSEDDLNHHGILHFAIQMAWKMNPPSSFSSISYRNNDDFYHLIGHHRFGECHTSYQSRPNNNQD